MGYRDDVNLYAYVGNDPINSTDPSGTVRCSGNNCTEIREAASRARSLALDARNQLREIARAIRQGQPLTAEQAVWRNAFERRFGAGSATESRLNDASRHFGRVANRIGEDGEGARIVHSLPQGQDMANAAVGGANEILIRPLFLLADAPTQQ